MSDRIETLLRESAPRVTREPEVFLAALAVSDEAAATRRVETTRRRRAGIVVATATVFALAGTTAAAAATQSLWWSAPHQVVAEAIPLPGTLTPVTQVSYILAADVAPGVDGDSEAARAAFQLAQQWLADRPVVVAVPAEAQTLPPADQQDAATQGVPAQVALEQRAIAATQDALAAAVAERLPALTAELGDYLSERGSDPALIVIDVTSGVYGVAR